MEIEFRIIPDWEMKLWKRAHKQRLYLWEVNRELHKKTTPELALNIIKFLAPFSDK